MKPSRLSQHRSLLSRLTPVQRRRLLSVSTRESVRRGQTIFRQGDPAGHIWLLLEGWVHLVRSNPPGNGGGVVIFTITPEEALCGLSAVEARTYNSSALAATPCRVLRIPGAAFQEALEVSPAFAAHVLRLAIRRIRHIAQQYGSMTEPASHRLIRAVLRLREQFGNEVPMTHRELAQMAWTSTETAIRVVRSLKRRGPLGGDRGRVIVRDAKGLERALAAPAAI
jgi:CRP/FNR family transcriptional regulator